MRKKIQIEWKTERTAHAHAQINGTLNNKVAELSKAMYKVCGKCVCVCVWYIPLFAIFMNM